MKETIGQVIRRLRRSMDMTQEEMGDALGITAQAVSKWETDSGIPDTAMLVPIANLFGVSLDVLFGRDNVPTEQRVEELIAELEEMKLPLRQKFYRLQELLKEFPNQPMIQKQLMHCAVWLVNSDDSRQNEDILPAAMKAAENYIRSCRHTGEMIRMKALMIELLSRAGCFAEAEQMANEFCMPLISAPMALADIRHQQGNFPEEIRQRQESIAQMLTFLADEIAELGEAYFRNGQLEDALAVQKINLALPALIHGREKGIYHAPLQNFHAISGFAAAEYLTELDRQEDALDLLEYIFDVGLEQCAFASAGKRPITPLLRDIDMTPFHGEMQPGDYLHHITSDAFTSLRRNIRYQDLLARYAEC